MKQLTSPEMTVADARRGWGCMLALIIGAGLGFLAVYTMLAFSEAP